MEVISAAMNQSFFTLSLGIGAMAIFGSYIDKKRRLAGEAVAITILDTSVALISGLIIFPASFAFGVNPDSGPNLIFITLPNISIPWRAEDSGARYSSCVCSSHQHPRSLPYLRTSLHSQWI